MLRGTIKTIKTYNIDISVFLLIARMISTLGLVTTVYYCGRVGAAVVLGAKLQLLIRTVFISTAN